MALADGVLRVVSVGPGVVGHITVAARAAISQSQVVIGYRRYLEHIRPLLETKKVMSFEMGQEQRRAETALEQARIGRRVALVSGGDARVYGMMGRVLQLMEERGWTRDSLSLDVVPGVTAATACASLLGAPLAHDFVVISLSDRYVPWQMIERRLEAASREDFVIVIYEPASPLRPTHMQRAREIVLRHRSKDTPVGIVRDAYRAGQQVVITRLGDLPDHPCDMKTTVIIGNSTTRQFDGMLVTDRGYPGLVDRP